MSLVLTLIADPARGALDGDTVAAVRAAVATIGAAPARPDWLAPGAACDLALTGVAGADASAAGRRACAGRPIDIAVVPATGRRKRLLIADMESTVIENEMIDELAALSGRGTEIAAITRRAMAGELDFAASLRARVGRLAGVPSHLLQQAAARIRVAPGAPSLVATMRAHGATAALVSGGFEVFAAPVAQSLGFDTVHANRLVLDGDQLSGAVSEPILDAAAKQHHLVEHAAALDLALDETLAVGDGANDLAMLGSAGLGVAYHAKPVVAASAAVRIDHADLTALLYLQGYRAAEIVTA